LIFKKRATIPLILPSSGEIIAGEDAKLFQAQISKPVRPDNHAAWQPLLEAAKNGDISLLHSAHDQEHNSALVLKSYLEEK
jgi:uncharacterized protein YeaO (DUF488 family)